MGMFDYVAFEYKCPGCEAVLDEWQTKDGPRAFRKVRPSTVDNFYEYCDNCKGFVEITRIDNTDKFQVFLNVSIDSTETAIGPIIEIRDEPSLAICKQIVDYVHNRNGGLSFGGCDDEIMCREINQKFLQPFLVERHHG